MCVPRSVISKNNIANNIATENLEFRLNEQECLGKSLNESDESCCTELAGCLPMQICACTRADVLRTRGVRLATNGTNPDFSDQISVHFGARRQNVLKSDLKKIPDFSHLGPT